MLNSGEVRGLSYTRDGGLTWKTTLLGERIYNITAKDSLVLASSQSGLWKALMEKIGLYTTQLLTQHSWHRVKY